MYWNGLCVSRALFVKLGRHWPLSVEVLDFPDIPYYWFLCYTPVRTMSTDEKVLKILEDVQADMKGLKQGQKGLEAGQQALQDDMTAVRAETAKIPGLEQRLDHQGKLLTSLTATTATVLEEQQAQRVDIRSLHTDMQSLHSEVHASKEEVKGEIRAARAEAKRDNMDLKATVGKKIQSLDRRTTNIEEQSRIENPEKH
jgi:outer membrane murein-binding lipoprotein Lpp